MIRWVSVGVLILALSATATAQHQEPAAAPDIRLPLGASAAATLVPVGVGVYLMHGDETGVTLGLLLIVGGALVGPSTGSFMLGDGRRAFTGMKIRLAGAVGFIGGSAVAIAENWSGPTTTANVGMAVALLSIPVFVYGLAYNPATLRASASQATVNVGLQLDAHSGTPMPTLRLRF